MSWRHQRTKRTMSAGGIETQKKTCSKLSLTPACSFSPFGIFAKANGCWKAEKLNKNSVSEAQKTNSNSCHHNFLEKENWSSRPTVEKEYCKIPRLSVRTPEDAHPYNRDKLGRNQPSQILKSSFKSAHYTNWIKMISPYANCLPK